MKNGFYRIIGCLLLVIMCAQLTACAYDMSNGEDELDYVSNMDSALRVNSPSDTAEEEVEETKSPDKGGEFVTLRYKSKGGTVGAVQARLIELGYLHTEVTEYYGEATQRAVATFQRANGLDETGETDAVTYEALMADDAVPCPLPLEGIVIGIDPGCQSHSDHEQEAVAPDSEVTKNKASAGCIGAVTGETEYNINMAVALILRDELKAKGATVILTHESVDDNISNIDRANVFNDNSVSLAIVLHCNSANDDTVKGAFMLIPAENADTEACGRAAETILSAFCKGTGAEKREILVRDNQTILNWCSSPVVCLYMGHLSNAEEDGLLASAEYQKKAAQAIADGVLSYYGN